MDRVSQYVLCVCFLTRASRLRSAAGAAACLFSLLRAPRGPPAHTVGLSGPLVRDVRPACGLLPEAGVPDPGLRGLSGFRRFFQALPGGPLASGWSSSCASPLPPSHVLALLRGEQGLRLGLKLQFSGD